MDNEYEVVVTGKIYIPAENKKQALERLETLVFECQSIKEFKTLGLKFKIKEIN